MGCSGDSAHPGRDARFRVDPIHPSIYPSILSTYWVTLFRVVRPDLVKISVVPVFVMRSLVVVVTPPILDVMPANVTVEAGASLTLTCRDENDLARRTVNGTYHWYRDGRLLTSASASASASARRFSSCREMVEDLFPVGSLLKIANVQVRFLPLGFLSFSLSLSVCLSFFLSFVRSCSLGNHRLLWQIWMVNSGFVFTEIIVGCLPSFT